MWGKNLVGVVTGRLSSEDELQDDEDDDAVQERDEVQQVQETPQPKDPGEELENSAPAKKQIDCMDFKNRTIIKHLFYKKNMKVKAVDWCLFEDVSVVLAFERRY